MRYAIDQRSGRLRVNASRRASGPMVLARSSAGGRSTTRRPSRPPFCDSVSARRFRTPFCHTRRPTLVPSAGGTLHAVTRNQSSNHLDRPCRPRSGVESRLLARVSAAWRERGRPMSALPRLSAAVSTSGLTGTSIDVDGTRVHYVDAGDGAPLVFVHGGPAWSFTWRDVIARLADRFRCIA